MLALPELDIKYLKTGLDMNLRPHKQTILKRLEEKMKSKPLVVALTTVCLHSKYILDGPNSLLSKVANSVF